MKWLAFGVVAVTSIGLLAAMVRLHGLPVLFIEDEPTYRHKVVIATVMALRWFGSWVMSIGVLLASMGQWTLGSGPMSVALMEAVGLPWVFKQMCLRNNR